jgi:hypothetical protein
VIPRFDAVMPKGVEQAELNIRPLEDRVLYRSDAERR